MAKDKEIKSEGTVEGNEEGIKASEPKEVIPDSPATMTKDELIQKQQQMIEKLIGTVDKQSERMERLEFAADKSRLVNYDLKTKGAISPTVKVRRYAVNLNRDGKDYIDEKTVLAWKLTRDVVEKINGIWVEDQRITLYFSDNTKEDNVSVTNFERNYKLIDAEIKSKTEDETGLKYNIYVPDTKENLLINNKYVN